MPSLTRLATKCSKCPYVDACNHKRMQAEAYMISLTTSNTQSSAMPVLRRCSWVLTNIDNESDELGDFYDAIFEFDLVSCPSCGSINLREYDMSDDMQTMECECDKCDTKWIADLSIDGLKKITLQQK